MVGNFLGELGGNFDGDYLGEGWRTWGNYLGENFAGRVLGVMKRKEKKKEIGEVGSLLKQYLLVCK